MIGALVGLVAPSLLGSAGVSGLMGLGMNMLRQFGMQVVSQLASNAVDRFIGPGPLGNFLKDQIETHLGQGLEGSPRTTEGVADRISQVTGMDSNEAFDFASEMEELMGNFLMNLLEDNRRSNSGRSSSEGGSGGAESSGKSWIMAMAESLGKVMDTQWKNAKDAIDNVARIGENSISEDEDTAEAAKAAMPSATAEMQGEMQQFSMIMAAATTAIKTAGEANSAMARKQ